MIPTKNPVQNYRSAVLNFCSRSSGANSSLGFPVLFAMFWSGLARVFEQLSVLELLQPASNNRWRQPWYAGSLTGFQKVEFGNYSFYFCFSQRTLS
jgi:hypothetical protein